MSCESHRQRACALLIAAHPGKMDAQEAERIYQQARASGYATETVVPTLGEAFRRHRKRSAFVRVTGDMPPLLKKKLKDYGFAYDAKERILSISVANYRGAAKQFLDAAREAQSLADLGLSPELNAQEVAQVKAQKAALGAMDTLQKAVKKIDVLGHADLAGLYGRLASGLLGKPCRVVLKELPDGKLCEVDPQTLTFTAHPHPLGLEAPARENLLVTRMALERELACQKHTPPEIIATAQAMADGRLPPEGLSDAARQFVPTAYAILERARAERVWLKQNAGIIQGAYAARKRKPEWSGLRRAGNDASERSISGALTMLAVPFGGVSDEQWEGLAPHARATLKKLEPVIAKAVRGTPEATYRAALVVARELAAADLSPGTEAAFPKPPPTVKPVNLMQRCPHCQSFMGRDGQCHNPHCPGPQAAKPAPKPDTAKQPKDKADKADKKAQAAPPKPPTPKPEPKKSEPPPTQSPSPKQATQDERAQLIAELRRLEKKHADLAADLARRESAGPR